MLLTSVLIVSLLIFLTVPSDDLIGNNELKLQFRNKYINKEFNKSDLSNPSVFDEDEVLRYLGSDGGFQSLPSTRVPVFKLGKSIVEDHVDMILKLPSRMETFYENGSGYSHLELRDRRTNKNYKIGVEHGDHSMADKKWYLETDKKKYRFCDPTQINLYFDHL